MSNEEKKGIMHNVKVWLPNLYYIGTLITLFLIVAQVFFAKRAMIQSSEWENAKVTIENIERFKEKLKETVLYGKTEALIFADGLWPDFTTPEGWNATDTLRKIYWSFFEGDIHKHREDIDKSLSILNSFAYPIIMGYASEIGSYESVSLEFNSYTNFIMPIAFNGFPKLGQHVKLLHRLWRVRHEQATIKLVIEKNEYIEELTKVINNLLCFEGTEITPATLKQYEKKLEREFEKIQKEIEVFRKSRMK